MQSFEHDGSLRGSLRDGSLSTLMTENSTITAISAGLESEIKGHTSNEEKFRTNLQSMQALRHTKTDACAENVTDSGRIIKALKSANSFLDSCLLWDSMMS